MKVGWCVAISLALLVLCCGAEAEVQLRYDWQPGARFMLDESLEFSGTIRQGTGEKQSIEQTATIRNRLSVEPASKNQPNQLRKNLLLYSAAKTIAGQRTVVFYSPEKISVNETLLWEPQRDPTGSGHPEALEWLMEPRRFQVDSTGKRFGIESGNLLYRTRGGGSENILQFVYPGHSRIIPLPDKAVETEQSWHWESPDTLSSGTTTVDCSMRMTLVSIETEGETQIAHIRFDEKRSLQNLPLSQKGDENGPMAEFAEIDYKASGIFRLDVLEGRPLSLESGGSALLKYTVANSALFGGRSGMVQYQLDRFSSKTQWSPLEPLRPLSIDEED